MPSPVIRRGDVFGGGASDQSRLRQLSIKARTAAVYSSGVCSMANWLASGRITSFAPEIRAAIFYEWGRRIASSYSPATTAISSLIAATRASVQVGWVARLCGTNQPAVVFFLPWTASPEALGDRGSGCREAVQDRGAGFCAIWACGTRMAGR